MAALLVKDANGNNVTVNTPNADGRDVAANSRSVCLATEDRTTLASIDSKTPAISNGRVPVVASTFNRKIRDAFQTFPGANWTLVNRAAGDIVMVDGNACGASYLTVSLDPLTAGSETLIESVGSFAMPLEVAFGLHMSQRTLGQDISIELGSTQTPATFTDLAISSISQATTTLTIDTTAPHNLKPGMRIGVFGCTDARLNYASLVVATAPTPNRITATAGPGGTIQSLTSGPFTSGSVYVRPAMGGAQNGASLMLENASATRASFYIKAESGDTAPVGGAITGDHTVSIATTASAQPVSTPLAYPFRPSSEYRVILQPDRVQLADVAVDVASAATTRANFTQICPDTDQQYKVRIRAVNTKGLTVPAAQVVSAAKSGTTTATVTTATPHGLATGDLVQIFGARDQTNFANVTTPTAVTVVNTTTFTIVWGAAVTATTYGGFVCRPNGGSNIQGIVSNGNLQSVTRTSNILTVVTNVAVSGLQFGDLVNLIGVRVDGTGTSLGVDGSYRVRDIQTTSVFLEPVGTAPTGADIALTNCGGAMIRRTDLRLSYLRLFDFEQARVEFMPRPAGDLASAVPVSVNNTVTISQPALAAGTANIGYIGLQGPLLVNDISSAAITTTTTTAAITPAFGGSYEVNIPVTAVSGTNPFMDVSIEESDDVGANWYKVYDFPRISATGMYRSPRLAMVGNRVRYVQTIGGTTPSFTRNLNRLQYSDAAANIRQLIDRTLNSNLLNSTTSSLITQNCQRVQLVAQLGSAASPPSYQIEGSDDGGTNWYSIGAPLQGAASSTVQLTVVDVNAALVRVRVSVAGGAVTSGVITLKGF